VVAGAVAVASTTEDKLLDPTPRLRLLRDMPTPTPGRPEPGTAPTPKDPALAVELRVTRPLLLLLLLLPPPSAHCAKKDASSRADTAASDFRRPAA